MMISIDLMERVSRPATHSFLRGHAEKMGY